MTTMPTATLARLSSGFRRRYLDDDELVGQLKLWQSHYPDLIRLESIGSTPQGRTLWVVIVGPEPDRLRPAFWLNANMHAAELCGSNVALALIEDLLSLHLPDEQGPDLPQPILDAAREVLFYIMPRVSPDGAEAVLKQGRCVRSVPRDQRADTGKPRWRGQDLDGNGLILWLRYQDEAGEFVESRETPGLMLRRELEDSGPFYQLAVEGVIDNFDGVSIPPIQGLSDNYPDLNRNFPWSWAPEPEQPGAGPYPASEPETRALVDFTTRHPNIFAWADLHTFGGVFIRPLGHAPDSKLHPRELAFYQQLAHWAEHHTGYPTVSGFAEFTYVPDQPLRGDIVDYAYHQRGALAYTCELWDLFARLGLAKPDRFADHYVRLGREQQQRLWHWDREHNRSRVFPPWRAVAHPQLGNVEVGGLDPRIGVWNPPETELDAMCRDQVQVMLRVAAMAPRVRIRCLERQWLGPEHWQVRCVIENLGYLPTQVLDSAAGLPIGEPPRLELIEEGCRLVAPTPNPVSLEHLTGWGRGKYSPQSSLLALSSDGSCSKRYLSVVVRGEGSLRLRLSSPRLGSIETRVDAPSP